MDQASAPEDQPALETEIDAIRAMAVTTVLAPVNLRGETVGEWEKNPVAEPTPVGWKCLNHDETFNQWEAVETHLLENRTSTTTNQGSSEENSRA